MRRDPIAIMRAQTFAPRRELYVEGDRDVTFFKWLAKPGSGIGILSMKFVELPGCAGGERGRLLALGAALRNAGSQFALWADADHDRILGRPVPPNVWLTDGRDLEAYVLHEDGLTKILTLGYDAADRAPAIWASIRAIGRRLGFMRIASETQSLKLPFQETSLHRHVKSDGTGLLELEDATHLGALLQNANISLMRRPEIEGYVAEAAKTHAILPDDQLIHGKDGLCLVEEALRDLGLKGERGCGQPMCWGSCEPERVREYPQIKRVLEFLR